MFKVSDDVFDNPRFARSVFGGGLGWSWHERVSLKADLNYRRFGSADLRPETSARLAAGFQF